MLFPCNQFGRQEPGTHEEIKGFISKRGILDVESTTVFSKVEVNGSDTHDVFKFCRSAELPAPPAGQGQPQKVGDAILWNFTKFVIGGDGQVLARFGSKEAPSLMDRPELLGSWVSDAGGAGAAAGPYTIEPEPQGEAR